MLVLVLVSTVLGHALECVWLAAAHVVVLAKSLVLSFLDCLIGDVCCHRHCNSTAGSTVHSGLQVYLSVSWNF